MPRTLILNVARTSIFSLAILGYFIVIDQRVWVAEAKSNIITLVCSGKETLFDNAFPGQSFPIEYKHVFVVDLDKKLVDNTPAKVDEKSISYIVQYDGTTRSLDINRVTGEASITVEDNQTSRMFTGNCVKSEGQKF